MEMNPKNKAGCFAELLSALSAAIVTPDNRMYFNSGADTDRVRIAIQQRYSPPPDGKPDIANDVPEAIPYFCIEFRDYVPTITMGGSVFRLKNGKVNCFLHGQKLYTAPPRVVDEDMVFRIACFLAKQDGCDDVHHLLWFGSPPEPEGEVWQRYEHTAREALKAALEKP